MNTHSVRRRVLLSWFALPGSAVAALLVGAAMIAALGANPLDGYHALVSGAFGGSYALSSTAVKAVPLLLVGVGICIAFRANAFNIGGEGQIAMGGLAGTATALVLPGLPSPLLIPLVLLAGTLGGGQRELAEAIAGLRHPTSGSIRLDGAELAGRNAAFVRRAGLGYVPEERMRDGVVADFTVAENLLLIDSDSPAFSHAGFLRDRVIRRHCRQLVDDYEIRTPRLETPVRNLSGGNIQKLILARELSRGPRVLLAAQPTRGVDVGAASYIHERLREQRDAGTAIVVISEDLDEVLSLSDRILVMYEGTIIAEAVPRTSTREALGLMMAGSAGGA